MIIPASIIHHLQSVDLQVRFPKQVQRLGVFIFIIVIVDIIDIKIYINIIIITIITCSP